MGVKLSGLKEVKEMLNKSVERLDEETISAFIRAGQRLVEAARATKQYKDKTGNLTASIGYGVYKNGEEKSVGGFGGGDGEQQGRSYLAELAARYRSYKYLLILVAGMDYALYVERKGHVVLDGASLQAGSVLNEELNKIRL